MFSKTKMSEWTVYILRCVDGSLYTGISTNVYERIKKHNLGKGAAYTRSHRPVVLVWKKTMKSESAARKREAEIKSWTRRKKMSLIQAEDADTSSIGTPVDT